MWTGYIWLRIYSSLTRYDEHYIETSGSIKDREFLHELSDYY
jgi:hypothetical protein